MLTVGWKGATVGAEVIGLGAVTASLLVRCNSFRYCQQMQEGLEPAPSCSGTTPTE